MPELLEVEAYRGAAERVVGGVVTDLECPDPRYLRTTVGAEELAVALVGAQVEGVTRHGKVMVLHLGRSSDHAHTLGVRFGMTGRLDVDGHEPITELRYGPGPAGAPRFALITTAGTITVVDPRRLGSIELDVDLAELGPDAADLNVADLRVALASSRPLKAVLLDQQRVAGLGNLLVDETLWRAGLAPDRTAEDLHPEEQRRLARTIVGTVRLLGERGGSHTGDLQEPRDARGVCPRCATPLRFARIGGRTTAWCPAEQR